MPEFDPKALIGREQELKDLREHLSNQKQVVLVNGMGGIGKTALAQTYATFYSDNYAHITWVQQTSDDFRQDLISAEGLLHSLNIDVTGTVDELFPRVIHQLRTLKNQPNLLVIDNAFASLTKIKDQLPKQPHWHILITSREEIAGFKLKELGFLSEAAAIDLFKRHYTLTKLQDADIAAIVKAVDYHTLTIELLAKVAQRKRATLDELLTAIKNDITANVDINHAQGGEKVERIRSYLCSIFKADKLSEPEIHLLKQLTCLPTEFHTYETLEELLDVKKAFDFALSEILESLKESGWLIGDNKNDSYKMHQVIQLALFTQLNVQLGDVDLLIEKVIIKLSLDQSKDNPVDKFPWILFGRTIDGLFSDSTENRVFTLQNNLALRLKDRGDLYGAKTLLEKTIISSEKDFGEDHPTVATHYSNLGQVLHDLGDLQGAKTLLEKAMISDERSFGENHPNTARCYSNLGLVLQDLGDLQGAKALLEKAIISDEKNLGEDHPLTAICYSNLGLVLKDLGDLQEAKILIRKAMISDVKNLGEDHPTTAIRYSNLGQVLHVLGDFQGAKTLLEKAIISNKKNYGEDHPTTVREYSNLGQVLKCLGDLQGAKTLLEKSMISDVKNFGKDHPSTGFRYYNLATLFYDLQDYPRAFSLIGKALEIFKKTYPKDHRFIRDALSWYEGIKSKLNE